MHFGELLLLIVILSYALLIPYTKVEESFNLQAIHDLVYHFPRIELFDHHEFPGVVPRTFLGAILISGLVLPFQRIATSLGGSKFVSLLLVRGMMGLIGWWCFVFYSRAVRRVFGTHVGNALLVITLFQFHLPFYLSRPLPNTFALYQTLLAFGFWLTSRYTHALILFTFVIVIFRSEVALLFAPLLLELLLSHRITFNYAIIVGILATSSALALTILVDSFFWQRWLWPEGQVLFFNTVLNKSHEWGVAPWHWYFTSALPRALLCAPFLVLISLHYDWYRVGVLLRPAVFFVAVYSALPHKELRFIFYALPLFNATAAIGLATLCEFTYRNRSKSPLLFLLSLLLLLASLFAVISFTVAAFYNYPGGDALARLHTIESSAKNVSVHVDVFSAMTGVSRFGELNPNWKYSKDESPAIDLTPFTHLLRTNGTAPPSFKLIAVTEAFSGVRLMPWPRFVFTPAIHIFRRIIT